MTEVLAVSLGRLYSMFVAVLSTYVFEQLFKALENDNTSMYVLESMEYV